MSEQELRHKFWELPLDELNVREWEGLCDGCGHCCLKKFADQESEEVVYTRIVCQLFDEETSRCTNYTQRTTLVPDCLNVRDMNIETAAWMPESCAYRLRFEGKPLFDWHPLVAGSRAAMEAADILLKDKVISEEHVHPDGFEEHIIRWVRA